MVSACLVILMDVLLVSKIIFVANVNLVSLSAMEVLNVLLALLVAAPLAPLIMYVLNAKMD